MTLNLESRIAALEQDEANRRAGLEQLDTLDVLQHIAPCYYDLHRDIEAGGHTVYNLPGGRGSCKSSFVSLEIVNGIMKDTTGHSNAIVFRLYGNTMRESVFSQISWAIDTLGVNHLWRSRYSPMSFTYVPSGAQIVFRGLDDATKLKSIKPTRGTFRFIWLEEFAELPGPNFTRTVMQSVQRGGDDFTVFRSFNPPISKNAWANTFIAEPDPRGITLKTDYTMIPPEWLGDSFIYEAKRLKAVNPTAYLHEYMGEATGTGGEVFQSLEIREITPDEVNGAEYIRLGIDFGFAQDPACFIRASYDRRHETVYLLDEIYRRGLSNRQLADEIKSRNLHTVGRSYETYQLPIFCDSAEPKSIVDLRDLGLDAHKCHKFPGCVEYRTKWMQNRRIVVDPARTPNAYRELVNYSYETDKDGNILSRLPDRDNHSIDALAYALDRDIHWRDSPA